MTILRVYGPGRGRKFFAPLNIYSREMPESFTTLVMSSLSFWKSLVKAATFIGAGSMPKFCSRSLA